MRGDWPCHVIKQDAATVKGKSAMTAREYTAEPWNERECTETDPDLTGIKGASSEGTHIIQQMMLGHPELCGQRQC